MCRETGRECNAEVRYDEGITSHIVAKPCAGLHVDVSVVPEEWQLRILIDLILGGRAEPGLRGRVDHAVGLTKFYVEPQLAVVVNLRPPVWPGGVRSSSEV